MPKVSLIYYTGFGHPDPAFAARLLAFTKNTRLQMTPDGMARFNAMPLDELMKEMEYMATTIPSSWEFVDLIFAMNNLSRATAQQVTRTRTASFAMQSQRVSDMSEVSWDDPKEANYEKDGKSMSSNKFHSLMRDSISGYGVAITHGMPLEDARDLLPIGVHCNLVAKYNLRNLVELCRKRDSLRVQGPYVEIVKQMRELTLEAFPWAAPFFVPPQSAAITMIEQVAKELAVLDGEKGAMYKGLSGKLAKAADLIKAQ